MSEFPLNYPGPENQQVQLKVASGEFLFLVGANGTGKSSLMHVFSNQNSGRVRRITAHRQVWFQSDTIDITPRGRQQTEQNITNQDRQLTSRYRDDYAAQRSQVTIFDLIDSENVEARKIADAARAGNLDEVKNLASGQSPIAKMNDILRISNLHFQVEVSEGSKLNARRDGHLPYSIAELSDGERNALLIIANVLTAPAETLILLDEPERHLHRSIVSPLLTTLLSYREDCAFVISTHDVSLPLDQQKCASLLVRQYEHVPQNWIADYIEALEEIDNATASAVLGSRKIILFIEGQPSSLDLQIYQILFPSVSIKAVGSCVEVEKIVRGIRASEGNHWITAFGVIDKDNRSEEECQSLAVDGIIALEQYSVESLYYHPTTVRAVLHRISAVSGIEPASAFDEFTTGIVRSISEHKDRMAARIVERKVRDTLLHQAPNWQKILSGDVEINFTSKNILSEELTLAESLISEPNIAALVSRYPIRETPALGVVANCLGFQSVRAYEQAVRKMIADDDAERESMLSLIEPVKSTVNGE